MMKSLFTRGWIIVMVVPLLVSLACSTLTGGLADSQPEQVSVKVTSEAVYGSGSFNLPEPGIGLADLSSYTATLVITFNGTNAGQPQKWSKTYVMLATKEPAARQLTIEKTGDLSDTEPFFMVEMNGVDDERRGTGACTTNAIEAGASLSERFEPANFLSFVIGADATGSETVKDVAADHYTFDQRAMGEDGVSESTGELWVATDGGYVLKYLLTRKATAAYFGEGIEGTLSLDYELTDVNKTAAIKLPKDCPLGLVDAPQLQDASNVVSLPGVLTYESSTSAQDAIAFYQKGLEDLGWKPLQDPIVSDSSTILNYSLDDQVMTVVIAAENGKTTVRIMLGQSTQ